jgi:HlyD family secretion protein
MTGKVKIAIAAAVLIAVGTIAGRWLSVEEEEDATYPIKLYGNIDIRTADLAFSEQERIVQIWVEEGQRVLSGQPLALQDTRRVKAQLDQVRAQMSAQEEVVKRLETGSRPEEIAQARAEVAAAKAVLKNALLSFERLKTTSQAGVTSAQTRDDARAQLDVAQAQLKVKEKALALALEGPRKEDIQAARHTLASLEASRSLLEVRLSDMTLAPTDGVVQNRILEPGEIAHPNRPVIALALTDPKWVRVYVPEPKLGQVKLGLKANIYTDSYPDRPLHGWVGFVSPVAEFTPKSVETEELRPHLVYETRIFVKDPDDQLRLGMPVSVSIESTMSPDAPPPATAPASAAQG